MADDVGTSAVAHADKTPSRAIASPMNDARVLRLSKSEVMAMAPFNPGRHFINRVLALGQTE
jgi:hypothetical protein